MPDLGPISDIYYGYTPLQINTRVGDLLVYDNGIWTLTRRKGPIGFLALTNSRLVVAANQPISALRSGDSVHVRSHDRDLIFARFQLYPRQQLAQELLAATPMYGAELHGTFSNLGDALDAVNSLYDGR